MSPTGDPRFPRCTAAVVAVALLASFAPGFAARLVYERGAIETGELWRLASAHLVHEWPRLALFDLGALLVLGAWLERRGCALLVATFAAAASLASAAVWFLRADLARYQGASALVAGALVAAAVTAIVDRSRERVLALALLGAWIAKTCAELAGVWPAAWSPVPAGVESVAVAHAAGGLAGAGAALIWRATASDYRRATTCEP
ncbi:MAG: rhomboid family intramembrane serine protease [Porticoccaceae bacterium]